MIIGLTGLAGSGKTTASRALTEGYDFNRLAFADPLKDMLKAVGFTQEQLYGDQKEVLDHDLGITPRHAMQTLGTDWGRDLIAPDIWVKLWKRKAQSLIDVGASVVADDVRFKNEAQAIRDLGGVILLINRDGLERGNHVSESCPVVADFVIHNNGSESELHSAIRAIVEEGV